MALVLKKLNTAQRHYDAKISRAEDEIFDHIMFPFSVVYQPSDGWCLQCENTSSLTPMETVLKVIQSDGYFTLADQETYSI